MSPHTAEAIEEMRLARSYIEDIGKRKGDTRTNLAFATKHLANARAKDPAARLDVPDSKGNPVPFSIDDIAGEALFCEAVLELAGEPSEDKKREVVETLKKTLQYQPYALHARERLADLYLDLYDRASAVEVAREGVRVSPDSLDARKLLDRIESAPEAKKPSWAQRNPELIELIGGLAFWIGALLFAFESFKVSLGGLSVVIMTFGSVAWVYGHFKFKRLLVQKYIADEARKANKR